MKHKDYALSTSYPTECLYSMWNIGSIDFKNKWNIEGAGLKVYSLVRI